jgi:hypothetical protein
MGIFYEKTWPKTADGKNLVVHHKDLISGDGAKYDPCNIQPMLKFGHQLWHSLNGYFRTWGGR